LNTIPFDHNKEKSYDFISTIELFSPNVRRENEHRQDGRLLLLRITFNERIQQVPNQATRIMNRCSDIIALAFIACGLQIEEIPDDYGIDEPTRTLTFYQFGVEKELQEAYYLILVDFFTSLMRRKYHQWNVVSIGGVIEEEGIYSFPL
jgi:hypothetical protein